jgi:hypothetical protein
MKFIYTRDVTLPEHLAGKRGDVVDVETEEIVDLLRRTWGTRTRLPSDYQGRLSLHERKMMSLRERIKARPRATQQVEAFGETVTIRRLTAREQFALEEELRQSPENGKGLERYVRIVSWCLVDDAGERVFDSEHATELYDADGAELLTLAISCLKLNALTQQDIDAVKKKPSDQNGDSPSA